MIDIFTKQYNRHTYSKETHSYFRLHAESPFSFLPFLFSLSLSVSFSPFLFRFVFPTWRICRSASSARSRDNIGQAQYDGDPFDPFGRYVPCRGRGANDVDHGQFCWATARIHLQRQSVNPFRRPIFGGPTTPSATHNNNRFLFTNVGAQIR